MLLARCAVLLVLENISLSEEPQEAAFFPILQIASTETALVIRTRRDTSDMAATIRKVVRDLNPGIPGNRALGKASLQQAVARVEPSLHIDPANLFREQ